MDKGEYIDIVSSALSGTAKEIAKETPKDSKKGDRDSVNLNNSAMFNKGRERRSVDED